MFTKISSFLFSYLFSRLKSELVVIYLILPIVGFICNLWENWIWRYFVFQIYTMKNWEISGNLYRNIKQWCFRIVCDLRGLPKINPFRSSGFFSYALKTSKIQRFFMFSGDIETDQWNEIAYLKWVVDQNVIRSLPILFHVIELTSFGMKFYKILV